MTKGARVRN